MGVTTHKSSPDFTRVTLTLLPSISRLLHISAMNSHSSTTLRALLFIALATVVLAKRNRHYGNQGGNFGSAGFGGLGLGGGFGAVGGFGAGGGYGQGGGSSSGSCRYWCRTPQGQAYCCEGGNEVASLPTVKPGQCPPVRPQCPPTRNFRPPQQCSNDSRCPGAEKCCFDTCLQHHTCKPTISIYE